MQSQHDQALSGAALHLEPPAANHVAPSPHHSHCATELPTLPLSGKHAFGIKVARGFCEALYSTKDGPPPPERMDWLMGELDDLLTKAGPRSAGFYKLALTLVSFLAPLFILKPRPLWKLSVDDRIRALRKMEDSPLAAIVLACKTMVCIMYYEHPDVQREVGFLPGCTHCATTVRATPLAPRGVR